MTDVPQPEPDADASGSGTPSARGMLRGPLLVAGMTAVLLAPFLNKAFHVDDTVYLRIADEIRERPLSPYNFDYNWDYKQQSMWRTTQHPPLNSYILAAIAVLAGRSEVTYHFFYLLIAVGCALLMHALSQRFCEHPVLATLLVVCCPGFLVSAGNLMADIPLLFFWLLAVYLAVGAAETSQPWKLWLAGLAAAAAAMTKYFGIAVVPLLVAYWLHKQRRLSVHVLGLFLPVFVLFWWGIYAMFQSGIFHPLGAARFALTTREDYAIQVMNFVHAFSFLGGALFWPLLLVPLGKRLPRLLRFAVYFIVIAAVLREWYVVLPSVAIVYGVMVLSGVMLTAVGIDCWRRDWGPESTLLGLWLFGTLAFAMFFNWQVNVRVIMPAMLPAALLMVRWVESLDNRAFAIRLTSGSAVLTLAVSLVVAAADYQYAAAGRDFTHTTVRELINRGETVYFAGHLGFQYYMEQEGARSIDFIVMNPRPGDLFVYPADNLEFLRYPLAYQPMFSRSYENTTRVHTTSPQARAGFYSGFFGPLPFNVTSDPVIQTFAVGRVLQAPRVPEPP